MNDWSPFYDLSDRAAFIRTSVAVYMATLFAPPKAALEKALEDWQAIEREMLKDEEKRR